MKAIDVAYLPEEQAHEHEIDQINEEAFGPGRFARAAYRIREGGPHERALSFVAAHAGEVVGSVRMTRIVAGRGAALLLGPLAVRPPWKSIGIGRHLVALSVDAARQDGCGAVVLVGDESYYGPLGFKRIAARQVSMPAPVDPGRLLAYEIASGAVATLTGMIRHRGAVR